MIGHCNNYNGQPKAKQLLLWFYDTQLKTALSHKTLIFSFQVKDTQVLTATAQPNMLGRLNESNQLLEEIQKGLNAYLEKKQLFFPR